METATVTVRKMWGEREGVTLELLKKFTKPDDPRFCEVMQIWNYRGNYTETGDRRRKEAMGAEANEHDDWDAVACNGGVIVCVPRLKFAAERGHLGLHAHYWWAMSAITKNEFEVGSGVRPATKKEISAVVPDTQALLKELPALEYMNVKRVLYSSTGFKGQRWQKVPQDVRYFRFAAGYGCVSIAVGAGKGKAS